MADAMILDEVRSVVLWLTSGPGGQRPEAMQLFVPQSPLSNAFVCANVIAWGVLAFTFLPTFKNGDSPYVATATEKLDVLFGSSGLAPGGVLSPGEMPAAQHLIDLGSGDGAVVRAATRTGGYGRASGYEVNPGLLRLSELRSAGRANEVFHARSLWDAPLDDADVVVVYILPKFLPELGIKLAKALRTDAIVVSNRYPFPPGTPRLSLVSEVPVDTRLLNPDVSSSLYFYRVG